MSTKRKAPSKIAAPIVRSSAKLPTKTFVDEARATVTTPAVLSAKTNGTLNGRSSEHQVVSDSDDDVETGDDDASEDEDDKGPSGEDATTTRTKEASDNAHLPSPQDTSPNLDNESESDAEGAPPTFGDLVRGQETIDVTATLEEQSHRQLALANPTSRSALAPPSLSSLGTVLSQALRTDDTDLLESCLSVGDITTVRNTIERLDSSLAGLLLTALASRLHRRPGRAGTLMQWVQWTLVAHGGALASQPEVLSRLSALQKVLAERARGLDSLLILKGKLDMLEAQMTLRQHIQFGQQNDEGDEVEDENVIWVEGQSTEGAKGSNSLADADDGEPVELPSMNGIIGGSDDEEEDDDDDDESSEGDQGDDDESLDEADVDHDDVDESMGEDDDSDAEAAAPPRKVQKVAKGFAKGR